MIVDMPFMLPALTGRMAFITLRMPPDLSRNITREGGEMRL